MRGVLVLAAVGLRGRRRGGLVATLFVLTLAALGIAVGTSTADQGARAVDATAAEVEVAHLLLDGERAALARVADDPAFVATAGPLDVVHGSELVLGEDTAEVRLTALDDPDLAINRPLARSGRWASGPDEVVLDDALAVDEGLAVGDVVTIRRGSGEADFTVVGTALDLNDCFWPQCDPGRLYVTSDGLGRFGADAASAVLYVRLADPADADAVGRRLVQEEPALGTQSWLDTRDDILAVDEIFGAFITVFGLFVLVAAAVVVAGSNAVRMVARRREIGLLGAVGCTPSQITLALLGENLALGLAAAVVGWVLASLLAPALEVGSAEVLGSSGAAFPVPGLVITVVVIETILALTTIVSAWRAGRVPVVEVLRDTPPPVARVAGGGGLPARLSLLGVREALARPARSALAGLAVLVAVVAVVVAVGFLQTVDAVVADPARAGEPWDVSVVRGERDTQELEQTLGEVPGVASLWGQTDRDATIGDVAVLAQALSGDPAAPDHVLGAGRHVERPGEALVGYGLVQDFDLEVGSRLTFETSGAPVEVEVVGWYRTTEDTGRVLLFRLEDLQAVEPDAEPSVFRLNAVPGTTPEELASAVSERLGTEAGVVPTDADTSEVDPFKAVLWLIAATLALVAGANLAATLLSTTRAAGRAIGVQEALGFTPGQVVRERAWAAGVLGAVATLLGLPIGLVLLQWLGDQVTIAIGLGPEVGELPSAPTLVAILVLAPAAAAALGALAARSMTRLPTSELVRWE
ncbi:MAG: FtsX-like permease family protein [Acidimicrobiales bacterium]|nr:FtsX-like permease family protein [Acidimicrobiales bacterium]